MVGRYIGRRERVRPSAPPLRTNLWSRPMVDQAHSHSQDSEQVERWLPIAGFEGRYEVSSHGRIRSVPHLQSRRRKGVPYLYSIAGRILRPCPEARGAAFHVQLGRGRHRKIHHLVLETFVGSRPDGTEGLHADDDTSNNRLENLSWGTHAKNMADAALRGRTARGERNGQAKLTAPVVLRIFDLCQTMGDTRIARDLGLPRSTIKNIRHRKRWAHILPALVSSKGLPA